MRIFIDFDLFQDKKELHKWIKEALSFPDYYGNNLDALFDCLGDITEQTEIEYKSPTVEDEALKQYFGKFISVLYAASEENEMLEIVKF